MLIKLIKDKLFEFIKHNLMTQQYIILIERNNSESCQS